MCNQAGSPEGDTETGPSLGSHTDPQAHAGQGGDTSSPGHGSEPATCSHGWSFRCEARGGFTWLQPFPQLPRPVASLVARPWNLLKPPCSSPWRVGLAQAAPSPPMWKEAETASAGAAGGKRTEDGQVDGSSVTRTAGLGVRGSSPEGGGRFPRAPAVSPDMHAALPLGRGVLGMLRRASLRALCSGLFLVLLHWPTFRLCEYLYRRRRGCSFLLLCLPGIFNWMPVV